MYSNYFIKSMLQVKILLVLLMELIKESAWDVHGFMEISIHVRIVSDF